MGWNLKEAMRSLVSTYRWGNLSMKAIRRIENQWFSGGDVGSVEHHYDKLEGYVARDRVRFPDKILPLLRWAGSSDWSKILSGDRQLCLGSSGLRVREGSTGSEDKNGSLRRKEGPGGMSSVYWFTSPCAFFFPSLGDIAICSNEL